jgi:Membrane dipeptidase (Peptidase family M19)
VVAVAEEDGRMCRASCFDSWTRLLALARAGEDEPSSGSLSRRGFLAAVATPVLAAACARALPPPPGPTRDLLEATLSFDLHSHPGLFASLASDTLAGHRRSAEAGLVKVISLTATSDAPVIARSASGGLVDVAHATLDVVRGVTETTTQPIILSHSNIQDGSGWARFITVEHARLIAGTSGVIGAMPYVRGYRGDYLPAYVDHISRLVDAVGVEHVGVGTDMDGIGPGAVFTSYDRWPSLAQALLDRGYGREEVAKILGGNCRRVFEKVRGGVRAAARPRRETV